MKSLTKCHKRGGGTKDRRPPPSVRLWVERDGIIIDKALSMGIMDYVCSPRMASSSSISNIRRLRGRGGRGGRLRGYKEARRRSEGVKRDS